MDIITLALAKNLIKSTVGGGIEYEKISTLPEKGKKGTIYFLTRDDGSFSEYMYIDSAWELLGDSGEISLSWNDLTDKPFGDGETVTTRTLVHEGTIIIDEFRNTDSLSNFNLSHLNLPMSKLGGKYICITFNGNEYIGTVGQRTVTPDDENYYTNNFFNSEGFNWEYDEEGGYVNLNGTAIDELETNVPYDFKIEEITEVTSSTKTLDDKYISENIARVEWVESQIGNINSILATLSNGGVE